MTFSGDAMALGRYCAAVPGEEGGGMDGHAERRLLLDIDTLITLTEQSLTELESAMG